MLTIDQVMHKSSGLVRDCYDFIAANSLPIPEFSAGSAIALCSAIIAGSRRWPIAVSPADYFLLSGPASLAKSSFLELIENALDRACGDEYRGLNSLNMPENTGNESYHEALSIRPTRAIFRDEIGKLIETAYAGKDPKKRDEVLRYLKQHQKTTLRAVLYRDKDKSLPDVKGIHLTIASVMVNQQLSDLIRDGRALSDGLFSRFAVFRTQTRGKMRTRGKPIVVWPDALIQELSRIHREGIVSALQVDEKGVESVAFGPTKEFFDSLALHRVFERFSAHLSKEREDLDPEDDERVASVRDRILTRTQTFAMMHAVGRGASDVDGVDEEWALALCRWLWDTAREELFKVGNVFHDWCFRAESHIRAQQIAATPLTRRTIFSRGPRVLQDLSPSDQDRVLATLIEDGVIEEVAMAKSDGRGGNRRCKIGYAVNFNASRSYDANMSKKLADVKPRLAWMDREPLLDESH